MANKKFTIFNSLLFVGIFLILFLPVVSSFGIGSSYDLDSPLNVYPGESKNILMSLQSSEDEGVSKARLDIEEGSEIISAESQEYDIAMGEQEGALVDLKIEVPEDAEIGKEYNVKLKFSDISESEGEGAVGVSTAISKSFKVKVVEKPVEPAEPEQPQGIGTIWWVLGAIVVIIIIALIWMIVKNNSNGSESE